MIAVPETPTLALRPGEAALFGYGSLLHRGSMESTLGRPYDGPFLPCGLAGWRRSWDVAMPNSGPHRTFHEITPQGRRTPATIVYLNVRPDEDSVVQGILFVVSDEELAGFDRREWIYDRIPVTDRLRGVQLRGGDAFVYVGKPEYRVPPGADRTQAAVRRSYLGIVEQGLASLGERFRREYERSSDPVPESLVIEDRADP